MAQGLGCEKDWLKSQVSKLKNLGLTASQPVGYELSPRGRAALQRLRAGENTAETAASGDQSTRLTQTR